MPAARLWREHLFGAKRRAFLSHFSSTEQTNARNAFRFNMERAYRASKDGDGQGDLPRRLSALKWPADFPPSEQISSYAHRMRFDDNTEPLWGFAQQIIP
jgi:hypothetical protein